MKFLLLFSVICIYLTQHINSKLKSNNFSLRENEIKYPLDNSFKHSKKYQNNIKENPHQIKIVKIIFGTVLLLTLISIYKLYEEILALKRNHLASKFRHVINYDKDSMCIEDLDEKLTFVSRKIDVIEGAKDSILKFKDEEIFLRIRREVSVYNYLKEKWEILQESFTNEELLLTEVDFVNYEIKEDILKVSYEENNFIFPNLQTKNFNSKAKLNSIYLTSAQIHRINSNEKILNDIVDFKPPCVQYCSENKEIHYFNWK